MPQKSSNSTVICRVSRSAEKALRRGQPWVFAHQLTELRNDDQPAGARVVIYDAKNKFLAAGLFDPESPIRVRVLVHRKPARIDEAFFEERVKDALARRQRLVGEVHTDGYRLLHGPGDGLEGVVADRYGEMLVVKVYSRAWLPWIDGLIDALVASLPELSRVVLRLARNVSTTGVRLRGGVVPHDGVVLRGSPLPKENEAALTFREHGTRYEVDPIRGQKTGFFLDQRDNRQRVAARSADKSVLNVFSYTGGFSLAAARGGARRVVSVDISRPAIAALERNIALNRDEPGLLACDFESICGDAFDVMETLCAKGARFDLVVVDPPAFAKKADEIEGALQAYRRLARLSAPLVRIGGELVFASCSSRIREDQLQDALFGGAGQVGAQMRVDEVWTHAVDHPVAFDANVYLKCLFATRIA